MAKKDKAAKPEKAEVEKAEKATEREFKYGVGDLAEKLELEQASVRVKLRNANVAKAGKAYGWNTKKELDEVVEQLKAAAPAKADKADKPKKPKKGAEPEAAAEPEKSKKDKKDKKDKKKKDKSKD